MFHNNGNLFNAKQAIIKIGNTKGTAKYDLKMKPLNKNYRTP